MVWKPPLKRYISHSCDTWKRYEQEQEKEKENKERDQEKQKKGKKKGM
jgi:hypothetical protein